MRRQTNRKHSRKRDALVNSVPTAKGDIVSDYTDNAYTLTLNFVETESDFTGDYPGMDKDKFFANYEGGKKYSLTITNSMVVKFGEIRTGQHYDGTPRTYTNDTITNAQLRIFNGKYNATIDENGDGYSDRYHIEFDRGMTSFKFIEAHSAKGSGVDEETGQTINYDYGMKMTYTGTLTK